MSALTNYDAAEVLKLGLEARERILDHPYKGQEEYDLLAREGGHLLATVVKVVVLAMSWPGDSIPPSTDGIWAESAQLAKSVAEALRKS